VAPTRQDVSTRVRSIDVVRAAIFRLTSLHCSATNISPVVSFLLKRGLGNKGHLEICKSVRTSL
jgi:hypothetical protein